VEAITEEEAITEGITRTAIHITTPTTGRTEAVTLPAVIVTATVVVLDTPDVVCFR